MVSKINVVLWNIIQNNSCFDENATTNWYFSCWNVQTLRQPNLLGGLDVQQYDFQLIAMHLKWIVALIDPSTLTSWKNLTCNNLMQFGLRCFFITYKSILTLQFIPFIWKFYFATWFINGFCVVPPLLDFECTLNEFIWFRWFIKNGESYNHHFTHELLLILAPFYISNVVMRLTSISTSKFRFMNMVEFQGKYDGIIVNILDQLIKCIMI
jgi:hypothetical protein